MSTVYGVVLTVEGREAVNNISSLRAVQGLVERNDMTPEKQAKLVEEKMGLIDELKEDGSETLLIDAPDSGEALAVLREGYEDEPLQYGVLNPIDEFDGVAVQTTVGPTTETPRFNGVNLRSDVLDYIVNR